ncbi:hypothetical protein N7520_005018 [Penicillium odoratum]|uniref:uncharacterized protein n=1 Tax=Penicillium odoratum TaxID=1167516 RepID=UPI002548DB71|nr:uncharacterized protein N7520_005018 [Penicillium odoratum]KAJ5765459.1 hypothetical protein N7520_005018 [Penicillium odoratum]
MGSVVPAQEFSDRGFKDHEKLVDRILHDRRTQTAEHSSVLDKLPAEIIHEILSYLSARDLGRVSASCKVLAEHGSDDRLWANLVNSHLPTPVLDPGVFPSFRRLYLAHLPYWFIPQYKIWFADNEHTGNLILARYDNRRGVIEAFRLLADRGNPNFQIWQSNPDVMIQSFDPKVFLWLDDAVLDLRDLMPKDPTPDWHKWKIERIMAISGQLDVFSSLLLCEKPETPLLINQGPVWPPLTIPSEHRIRRANSRQKLSNPENFSQASERAFRIRRWAHFNVMDNELRTTYATLDPSLYMPTREKPYQGIWVGDYSAHGCEFLLFIQRGVGGENPEHQEGDLIHSGSLEAVKLTGDPNVPRGAISFVAHDIGPGGLIRVDDKEPFENARIVRSLGHVAGIGFQDDTFITSQLILISPDTIAHYWEEMGHVSYYRRVDIDALIRI